MRAALHLAAVLELSPEARRELLAMVVGEHLGRLVQEWGEEGLQIESAHELIIAATLNALEPGGRAGEDGDKMQSFHPISAQ